MATTNPLSSINASLAHGTPPRERYTMHRLEAHSNTSSPATIRSVSSFSSPNPSGHNPQELTVDGLLAASAHTSNPPLAALEAAVADRNTLGTQNAQLWKLMEKQRAGYGQLLKELERIRGERDAYRSRLQSLGENTDALLRSHRDREKREGKESSLRSAASHSHLRNGGEHGSSSSAAGSSTLDPRGHTIRANSDDIASRSPGSRAGSSSRSTDTPIRRERQGSQNSISTAASANHSYSPYLAAGNPASANPSSTSLASSVPSFVTPAESSLGSRKTSSLAPSPTPESVSISNVASSSAASAVSVSLSTANPSQSSPSSSSLSSSATQVTQGSGAIQNLDMGDPVLGAWHPNYSSSRNRPSVDSIQSGAVVLTPATPSPVSTDPVSAPPSRLRVVNGAGDSDASAPSIPSQPQPPSVQPAARVSSLANAQKPSSSHLSPPMNGDATLSTMTSRESRISLPEEAKRYYASIGDSPFSSPAIGSFSSAPKPEGFGSPVKVPMPVVSESPPPMEAPGRDAEPSAEGPEVAEPVLAPQRQGSLSVEGSEFLDMEDEESLFESGADASTQVSIAEDSLEPEETEAELQIRASEDYADATARGKPKIKHAHVEDFPLPPSTPLTTTTTTTTAATVTTAAVQPGSGPAPDASTRYEAQARAANGRSSTSSDAHPPVNGRGTSKESLRSHMQSQPPSQSQSQQQHQQQLSQAQQLQAQQQQLAQPGTPTSPFPLVPSGQPHMTFRALPLLASDIPHTQIQVISSSIRLNDKGKDVISFVIIVDPGKGKESWKVEKLYSDVLGLDARVRATAGRSVGKKMPVLPEGRLWKDHAPAKVDQRKNALETYLRSLIALPMKNKDEIVAFFTSDIVREAQKPILQAGYKEGHLTKRGKNFGGWKTRFFVLQGPSLEYYESRGGAHLGSIAITGAQIGRQQRTAEKRESDEDNQYRHAFLIIEARKGPGGSAPRHVLCAESDTERDSWVEELVRYVTGHYSDDQILVTRNGPSPVSISSASGSQGSGQPRTSSSSNAPSEGASTPTPRPLDIAKGPAVPLSQLPPDSNNAKLFQNVPTYPDSMKPASPVKQSAAPSPIDHVAADVLLSSSLPVSSPLVEEDADVLFAVGQRANSELGHYPDIDVKANPTRQAAFSPEQRRNKARRMSVNPLKPPSIPERGTSPEKDFGVSTPRVDSSGKVKISGPMNGIPLPAGYKFGKDAPPIEPSTSSSDRREKAKSRSFWAFGRQHEKAVVPDQASRAVFGVGLEDSLEVAQIATLPAIVFRCIQYLEGKNAQLEEGIYRLSGSSAVIKGLKDRFNAEGDVDLLGSDEYWDVHAIAGLLKNFLRELPASILTRDLHLRFLSVIDFADPQERVKELSRLIASLPIANYSLLRALTAHLILIVQNANVNKMTMRNVGIVFSPTLGIPAGVFSLMLGEFNRVFNVDGTLDDDSQAVVEDGQAELGRRNSKQYSDAAADKLLGLSGRTLPISREESPLEESEEVSIAEESGTEDITEDSDNLDSSLHSSDAYASQASVSMERVQSPDSGQVGTSSVTKSRAAGLAASRGLNIDVNEKANRRRSGMVGLPRSPRPQGYDPVSSPHTPQMPNGTHLAPK